MEQNQVSSSRAPTLWSASELENLAKALTVIGNGQKAFGRMINVTDLFNFYRLKLEGRFSMASVMAALHQYTDRKNDIPAPADLINIISPPPKKVTTAEYIAAREAMKISGYHNPHSAEAYTIREYEAQRDADEGVVKSEPLQLPNGIVPEFRRLT